MEFSFLVNARLGKNNWWRYLLTLIVIFFGLMTGLLFYESFNSYISLPGNINEVLDIGTNIVTIFLLVFLFVSVYKIHKRSPMSILTSHKSIQWKNMFKGAYIWFFLLCFFTVVDFIMHPKSYTFTFSPNTFGWLVLAAVLGLPLLALLEEVIFRGYLLQAIGVLTRRPIVPLIITSVIFGSMHYLNGINQTVGIFNVIVCALFGLMLGVIVIGEGGLETAIGVHLTQNLFASVICSNPTDIFGAIPSIVNVSKDNNLPLIMYTPDIVLVIAQIVLFWLILFWGKTDLIKEILSWKNH
ncbi:MAG: type II CAAX endopeptidase family protein [Methanobacterium sp.]|nr:type II CAAX endopeptidase family protein [Methanobacterium sp.]